MTIPSVEDVDRIARLPDPVLRNLQITQCYHQLSLAMRSFTGPGANWCTFATWASKQAGQTIRGDDLIRHIQLHLRHAPEVAAVTRPVIERVRAFGIRWEIPQLLDRLLPVFNPVNAVARSSDAVARGNKKVFEEIAAEFARFLAMFAPDSSFNEAGLEQFWAGLRPGDPPKGQHLLREAFAAHGQARVVEDPDIRSEWLFFANLLIGFHEQTRLQPEIAEALTVAIQADEVKQSMLEILLPGFWVRLRHRASCLFGGKVGLDRLLDRLAGEVQQQTRRAITEHLMTLQLPGETLYLGRDLPAGFPEPLTTIANPRLKELLSRIDATPDSVGESGARDWAHFEDRMHFITDFFRGCHARPSLFDPPFTEEQVIELQAGRKPAGQL